MFSLKKSAINLSSSGNIAQSIKLNKKELTYELDKINKKLNQIFANYSSVYGFPINCTYVNCERVWEEIRITDIHSTRDEDVEMNLSVYVNAYPNRIYSVWIYFGILKR